MRIDLIEFQQRIQRHIPPHRHPVYEFHYVTGGSGVLEREDGEFPVRGGCFFVIPPGMSHRLKTPEPRDIISQYLVHGVPAPADDPAVAALAEFWRAHPVMEPGPGYCDLFERLRFRFDSDDPAAVAAVRYRFLAFLLELAMVSGHGAVRPPDDRTALALRLMQARVRRKLTLPELCRQVGLEQAYFIRRFRKEFGVTPMKYFARLKINAACNLLEDTAMSVGEVAAFLGFKSEFHFSRAFRKIQGCAPSRYRLDRRG